MKRFALIALPLVAALAAPVASSAPASRAPTHAERAAILAGLPRDPILHQPCLRYVVRVSTVDPAYAYVAFGFPRRLPPRCKGFNGTSVMERGANGRWKQVVAGSSFYCDGVVPGRVIREFFTNCTYGESDHFYSPSGNIECAARNHGTALACVAFDTGRSAVLSSSGRVQVHAPPPAGFFHRGSGTVLPYGQFWTCSVAGCPTLRPLECESLRSGMRCDLLVINGGGPDHGFVIASEGVRTF